MSEPPRMTPAQLREQFDRWTYSQPGYRLELRTHDPLVVDGFAMVDEPVSILRIFVTTTDTYRPHDPAKIEICHSYVVPPYICDPDQFGGFLLQCIHLTVEHEACEWLRRDGVMVFDPHHMEKSGS